MLAETLCGPSAVAAGQPTKHTSDRTSAQRVSDAHGRYMDAVLNGNVYIGSNLGGTPVATQAGLSATTPALTAFNPFTSTVNMVLLACGIAIQASPAAAAELWLAYNVPNVSGVPTAPITTTNANVVNAKLTASSTNIGQCYRVATLNAAPLMLLALGGTTGASAIGGVALWFDLAGIVVIPPGFAVSLQTSTAAAVTATFVWEEVPV